MNKKLTKGMMFGGAVFQLSYIYFMYTAVLAGFQAIGKEADVDTDAYEATGIAVSIILAIMQALQDLLSINPAEQAYKMNHPEIEEVEEDEENEEGEQQDIIPRPGPKVDACINIPLKFVSVSTAHVYYIVASAASSLPFLLPAKNTFLKIGISLVPIGFGTIYYRMLSYDDILTHHNFIYRRLLSTRYSIIWNMLKSPLLSLELLLTVGSNASLKSASLSYIAIRFVNAINGGDIDDKAYPYIILFVCFVTEYSMIFSRLLPTYVTFFDPKVSSDSPIDLQRVKQNFSKSSFVFNTVLRSIRSAGIAYIASEFIPVPSDIKILSGVGMGMILFSHGAYVSYKRCFNEAIRASLSDENMRHSNNNANKKYITLVNVLNMSEKFAAALAILAAFIEINQRLKNGGVDTHLNFVDILCLFLSISIPVLMNSYDFYNQKLIENILYHKSKYQLESQTHQFGKFMCLFKSVNEYTEDTETQPFNNYSDNPARQLLSDHSTDSESQPLQGPEL